MKVFLIDRYPRSGQFLAERLEQARPDLHFCGQAYTARTGLEQVKAQQPDVVLVEPLVFGNSVARFYDGLTQLQSARPETVLIAISASDHREHIRAALRAGVRDYLYKPLLLRELLESLDHCCGVTLSAQTGFKKQDEAAEAIVHLIQKGDSAAALKALERAIRSTYQELSFYHLCVCYMEIATMVIHLPDNITSVPEQLSVLYQNFIKSSSRSRNTQALNQDMREFVRQSAEVFNQFSGDSGYHRMEEAMQFVEEHLSEPLTLRRLANELFLSPTYFSRLFKEKSGRQFSEYLVERRISRAKLLLTSTDLAVSEISRQVGYTEANSFSRVFKAKTGKTPLQYRKQKM